jgi:uncharacterized protein (DUF2062 family)/SAM-dependent methyltransferase
VIRGLRARVHALGRALLAAHATPGRLAAAVLVGAIVGTSPLFGLHLPLCIAAAAMLRLNQPTVYAAANVSIPPLAPLLGFASVEMGERLLHGRWLPLVVDDFRHPQGGLRALAARFFVDWLAGGALVGAAIGAVLAAAVYAVATRRRANQVASKDFDASMDEAIAEATRRYAGAPPGLRHYARFKYLLDPCYRRIAALVPEGAMLCDLGTGLGMLPLVVALLPGARRAVGVEWDAKKLAAGRAACAGLPVELVEGDVRACAIPPCDVLTLVDVLHYYDAEARRALLARAAAALGPGGRLLVREGDARRRGGGARWTRLLEWLAVRLGWNRGEGATRFAGADELVQEIESLGFAVRVEPLAGRLHPGNVLLVAERRA